MDLEGTSTVHYNVVNCIAALQFHLEVWEEGEDASRSRSLPTTKGRPASTHEMEGGKFNFKRPDAGMLLGWTGI